MNLRHPHFVFEFNHHHYYYYSVAGSDSGGEQISADDNALLGVLCVSPSEVTSAALTPLSSGPHSNNPSTPRQHGVALTPGGHGHLQTVPPTDRSQSMMAGSNVAMDCGGGDPMDNMSSSSEGVGDVGSPDNGLLFSAPGSVGAKTPLCHMPTPPQHHGACGDDLHRKTAGFMELTTMYPTPPSLEPNAAASPCNGEIRMIFSFQHTFIYSCQAIFR